MPGWRPAAARQAQTSRWILLRTFLRSWASFIYLEQQRFAVHEHRLGLRRLGTAQLHLDHEAANIGLENRMSGMLFAGKNLLHRSYLAACRHVQITVINRSAHRDAARIGIGHKSEVDLASAGNAEIVRRLLGRGDGLFQPG